MKTRIKLMSIVGTVAAAAALAVSPLMASAAEEAVDLDAAVIGGHTTSLLPDVQLTGGSGTYSFTTVSDGNATHLALCVGVSVDVPGSDTTADAEATAGCTLTSSGSYTNVVCGTGTADGSATLSEGGGSDSYSSNFHIQFVAGLGLVGGSFITVAPGVTVITGPASATEAADGNSNPIIGVVQLLPPASVPPPAPNCVDAFNVIGVLATTA